LPKEARKDKNGQNMDQKEAKRLPKSLKQGQKCQKESKVALKWVKSLKDAKIKPK
jgi:hypothetical protein